VPRKKIDLEAIRATHPIENVIGHYVPLRPKGSTLVGLCPFHEEKTGSFTVNRARQRAHCFGCQWDGDVFAFVMDYENVGLQAAAKLIAGDLAEAREPESRTPVRRETEVELVVPVPGHARELTRGSRPTILNRGTGEKKQWGSLAAAWPYYRQGGELVGYVIRVDLQGGDKLTPQVMWAKAGDWEGWTLHAFPVPRPLYRPMSTSPEVPESVLVVEGEKAADAAAELLGEHYEVVTWPGGTGAVRFADLSALAGRDILLWPDADEAGYDAMLELGRRLEEQGGEIRMVRTMQGNRQEGWDLADALAVAEPVENLIEWAKARVCPIAEIQREGDEAPVATPPPPRTEQRDVGPEDSPFRVLGYGDNLKYYMPTRTALVVPLTPAQHTQNYLQDLAPLPWWKKRFPTESGISWAKARDWLYDQASAAKVFEIDRVRGRGAWVTNEQPVFHSGSRVWNGQSTYEPAKVPGWYVYPVRRDLGLDLHLSQPASAEKARCLLDAFEEISWENPRSARLLAGWTLLAPVCGVLEWRPHVWITGPAGSGKTTVLKIVSSVLGRCALTIEGASSEAGIRQDLGPDARPVLFDEAEAEDDRSSARLRAVIDLARMASSGGEVLKGSASGQAMRYCVRSCFCLVAVNPQLQHAADQTRFSRLILRKEVGPDARKWYEDFVRQNHLTFTPDYSIGMLTRSVTLLPALRATIPTMITAAQIKLDDRRAADQVGTLLAGAWFCEHDDPPSLPEAESYAEAYADTRHTALERDPDAVRCLNLILTHRVDVQSNLGNVKVCLGELMTLVYRRQVTNGIQPHTAKEELSRWGIQVYNMELEVANVSPQIQSKIMRGTPWASEWGPTLKQLPGVTPAGPRNFIGVKSRVQSIPREHWLSDGQESLPLEED
jgi:putative DNA primase/helicase